MTTLFYLAKCLRHDQDLYSKLMEIDLWFPQTMQEYFESILEEKNTVIHLFREILVQVKSVPTFSPPLMEKSDTHENKWIPEKTYIVSGIHDYGYWVLFENESTYKSISKSELKLFNCQPVVKTISFRPCGISSVTSEVDREV